VLLAWVSSSDKGDGPVVVYSGSPVRIDFSEEADVKGYIVGEIGSEVMNGAEQRVSWELVESGAASFHTLTISLDSIGDSPLDSIGDVVEERVRDQFAEIDDLSMAVVRVVVRGSRDALALVDDAVVAQLCREVRYFVGVVREVVDEHGVLISTRGGNGVSGNLETSGALRDWEDVATQPFSLVQEYLDHSEGDVKRRKRLKKLAKGLIDEVLGDDR